MPTRHGPRGKICPNVRVLRQIPPKGTLARPFARGFYLRREKPRPSRRPRWRKLLCIARDFHLSLALKFPANYSISSKRFVGSLSSGIWLGNLSLAEKLFVITNRNIAVGQSNHKKSFLVFCATKKLRKALSGRSVCSSIRAIWGRAPIGASCSLGDNFSGRPYRA